MKDGNDMAETFSFVATEITETIADSLASLPH